MHQPLGLENLVLAAGLGFVSGIVGTLGIKAVFAFKKLTGKKHHAEQSHMATATHQPTSPPPPATREDWERHGFGPAIGTLSKGTPTPNSTAGLAARRRQSPQETETSPLPQPSAASPLRKTSAPSRIGAVLIWTPDSLF
jgi:hypothetical protein